MSAQRRKAGAGVSCLLCGALLISAGCSSVWTLRTQDAPLAMQWPPAPEKPLVTYATALKGFSGGSGPASALLRTVVYGSQEDEENSFVLPVSVAAGSDGRLAVADTGARGVHLYIPSLQKYLLLRDAGESRLATPVGVIFDDRLNLYVADSSAGQVFVFGRDGEFLHALDRAGDELFKRPTGLAYSGAAGLLYVVDTAAHRIHGLKSDGSRAFSFGGLGEEPGRFNFPTHVFRSSAGLLYVTDAMNFRVQIFDESGAYLRQFGSQGDRFGDFARPKGVAAARDGMIFVADNLFDNVQVFNSAGLYLLTIGGRGLNAAEFWMPSGLFMDDRDTLYVCDTYNRRILLFHATGGQSDEKR